MTLLCAAIRKELNFLFRSHDEMITCEISSVCRLKYPLRCFSFHFSFLVFIFVVFLLMLSVLLLVTIISLFFFCYFWCSPRVLVLIHLRNLQCNRIFFLPLFLTHIVCLCHLLDVQPCASSSTFFL